MSDLEAGGALATAALAAKALEPEGADAKSGKASHAACANCHAPTVGAFCHRCGQKTHVHRSLLHLGEELLHGVLHLDSKLWRTLPMLFVRPGLLTRRFVEGQRARYISPLPLFLFSIFLMFYVMSFSSVSGNWNFNTDPDKAGTELQAQLKKADQEVAERQAAVDAAGTSDARAEAEEALADARSDRDGIQQAIDVMNSALKASKKSKTEQPGVEKSTDKPDADTALPNESGTQSSAANEAAKAIGAASPILDKSLRNPELMKYKLKNTAYKFSFLLIPISLPFLWLLFARRRDVHLYDHAIFATYSLSFMALFVSLFALLSAIPIFNDRVAWLLWAVPLHMFWQLREAYQIGYVAAAWRTVALLVCSAIGFLCFLLLVAAISAQ